VYDLQHDGIYLDHEIEFKVLHEHFYDNALYHSVCMTNYLLKTPKEKVNLETSDHETAFTICIFLF
jgi:hypothetical protein